MVATGLSGGLPTRAAESTYSHFATALPPHSTICRKSLLTLTLVIPLHLTKSPGRHTLPPSSGTFGYYAMAR